MKINNLKLIYLAVGLSLMVPSGVEAATLSPEAKSLDQSVTDLITAKDETAAEEKLSPEEELAYRKKVVDNALSLSLKEVATLRKKIDDLSVEDDAKDAKKEIILDLDGLEVHYKEARKLAEKIDDIEKIKEMAVTERDYRETKHGIAISRALDFILIFQAEPLIRNAETRYEKIGSDLKRLGRANLISEGKFTREMNEAKDFIANARMLINKARSIAVTVKKEEVAKEKVAAELGESETSLIGAETTPVKKTSNEDASEAASLTSRELSEAAITNLKSGYDAFIKISVSVKKTLGAR